MNDLQLVVFTQRMSSREIAELTGKEHGHVLRDIRNLESQGAINQSNFGLVDYIDAKGEKRPEYLLDFDATMTLVTGYNAVLRAKVIRRWRELEEGGLKSPPSLPLLSEEIMVRSFKANHEMALLFGLEGNQALLAADKAVRKLHNISPAALLEIQLKSPENEALIIATEIGKRLNPPKSPGFVNMALAGMGFLERVEYKSNKFDWRLTDKGKEYGTYLDTGKKHSDGTPVQQIKWKESVVPLLRSYLEE